MDDIKARAQRSVERTLIPSYLRDTMADLDYWQRRLEFWELQAATVPQDAPHRLTVEHKLFEVQEILDAFTRDARQLNRKLR